MDPVKSLNSKINGIKNRGIKKRAVLLIRKSELVKKCWAMETKHGNNNNNNDKVYFSVNIFHLLK
jgi:hypothetical protein